MATKREMKRIEALVRDALTKVRFLVRERRYEEAASEAEWAGGYFYCLRDEIQEYAEEDEGRAHRSDRLPQGTANGGQAEFELALDGQLRQVETTEGGGK